MVGRKSLNFVAAGISWLLINFKINKLNANKKIFMVDSSVLPKDRAGEINNM